MKPDPITREGDDAKFAVRRLTSAGRYLQSQAKDRLWYDKPVQEACKILFVRASDIRKEYGIIPPD